MVSPQHSDGTRAAARTGAPPAGDSVTQATYLKLAQKYLDRRSTTLFKEYTGMRVIVKWAPPPPLPWRNVFPAGKMGYCRLICSKKPGREMCRAYAAGQLKLTLEGTGNGHRCICPFGVRSVWVLINIRGVTVGVVLCQALCKAISSRAEERVAALGLLRAAVRRSRRSLCTLPKSEFDRAVRFLELIVDHVRQHAEKDLEHEELVQSTRAVAAHEALETRLRTELNHVLPCVNVDAAKVEKESHSRKIVRQALEYIHENFRRTLLLQEVADMEGLNGSYFSTLFAQHMGISFSSYLRELRVEKAQELLHDPRQRIGDVAHAVGFADPNTFRLAFKRLTGLSPTAWRDTFNSTS